MTAVVLLVEDEPGIRAVTREALAARGYKPVGVASAEEALAYLQRKPADIVVSDIQLPGLSGLKLCELLKGRPETASLPVILLTVLSKTQQKIQGLRTGADDYLTKPFDPDELAARVEAVLRRARREAGAAPVLSSGPVTVDMARHEALAQGKPVGLRRKEFELLVLFLRKPGQLLTRAALTAGLWSDEVVVSPNALEVHVKNLRRRLGRAGARIETVFGEGYRWNDR